MDIRTKFGVVKNVKIENYGIPGNETYTLGYIKDNENGEYELFGFDAPVDDDMIWRFWVEHGHIDGSSETEIVELSKADENLIKDLYKNYK